MDLLPALAVRFLPQALVAVLLITGVEPLPLLLPLFPLLFLDPQRYLPGDETRALVLPIAGVYKTIINTSLKARFNAAIIIIIKINAFRILLITKV